MPTQNILDALSAVISWDVSDELFSDAVLSQACLLAGISPDDIDECGLD